MARKLTEAAQAAKLIRAELKRHNVKAKVRSENYSGGSSVRIKLIGDPLPATIKAVREYTGQYCYGHFDGMTDCYNYSNSRDDIPQVRHIFVDVEYSDEIQERVIWYLIELKGYAPFIDELNRLGFDEGCYPANQVMDIAWKYYNVREHIYKVLQGDRPFFADFWTDYKPHVRASI